MGRAPGEDDARPRVQCCTVADARYFPGLVALVNSLRLLGHDEQITVLDLGLTGAQRAALSNECTVVELPMRDRHAWLYEPSACLARPSEIVVYLDADVIVTRPLDELIAQADDGRVVVFPDRAAHRRFTEWAELFDLAEPLRHQPYANAGFLAVSTTSFPGLLPRWAELCEGIARTEPPPESIGDARSPLGFTSQDALNAILMSEMEPQDLAIQSATGAADRSDMHLVDIIDAQTLDCRFAGERPQLLHYWGVHKPWHLSGRRYVSNAYSKLLRRLLVADDVAVRIDPHEVPRWLRPGPIGNVTFGVLEHVVPAVRTVIDPLRRRRAQPPAVATANR